MEQYEFERMMKRISYPDGSDPVRLEEVQQFAQRLWFDYIGAYNEGKADGLQKMAEILMGNNTDE